MFGRAYPLATPLLGLHTSLPMNRLVDRIPDRYSLLIGSLYDSLYKKIQFLFFLLFDNIKRRNIITDTKFGIAAFTNQISPYHFLFKGFAIMLPCMV